MSARFLPGSTFSVTGGTHDARKQVRDECMRIGMVPARPEEAAEVHVRCMLGEGPAERNYVRASDLCAQINLEHAPRDLRHMATAIETWVPEKQPLTGKAVTLVGGFAGGEGLQKMVKAMGGTLIKAPSVAADIVLCGMQDTVSERLQAIKETADGRILISEWQLYDMLEPVFTGFPPTGVQKQLALDCMFSKFVPAAPADEFALCF